MSESSETVGLRSAEELERLTMGARIVAVVAKGGGIGIITDRPHPEDPEQLLCVLIVDNEVYTEAVSYTGEVQ